MAPRKKVRQREAQLAFEALSIEGGLISPEWLAKVAQLDAGHQAEADYRVPKGLNLRDEIGRYWRMAQAHWADFARAWSAGTASRAVTEQFVTALLKDCLGFGSLARVEPVVKGERTYPLGHAALEGRVPVVLVAPRPPGDIADARKSALDDLSPELGDGGRKRSAFGLAQEYLNAEDDALWAIACDGLTLRIGRDNASLTRPAWIEADLARLFAEERYADFAALWLLAHETRFGQPGEPASACHLEAWRNAGKEEGTRAREFLRDGVEEALKALGRGFLAHPDNQALRAALAGGTLTRDAYFQELLRLVYRLIFLLTAEERELLHPEGVSDAVKARYLKGYSLRRLRDRSARRSAHDRFGDLWEGLKIVLRGVGAGEPRLGLPALGGLFDADQCPHLDAARLENRALLGAVFRLAWLKGDGGLARVNWRDMGPEELGSVYESLLELVPVIPADFRGFSFATGAETKGNARKTTGSYYTPDSLVQVLLDSALEPVVKETIARNPAGPVEALLQLTVVDPACGSGHFLLAAARRLAVHVARLQANGTPSAAEYRSALRQVVSRCLFGVDLNPMAVELCRVSLWMEAMEPGRPLSFLDSHIQRGNALLGTTPELMAKGIPDAAFEPIEGDDNKTASYLKKRNKAAAEGQRGLEALWASPAKQEAEAVTQAVAALEAAPDADLPAVAAKESRWEALQASEAFKHQKLVADAWCAAFVWPKPKLEEKKPSAIVEAAPTNELWRQIRDGQGTVPALTAKTVAALTEQYRFFHWHLAFPQVFARGGFDVVLGNPPWDTLSPDAKEFFSVYAEGIRFQSKGEQEATIERLLMDPTIAAAWTRSRRTIFAAVAFLRESGRYTLFAPGNLGKGDFNLYRLFVELALRLARKEGWAAQVVPDGFYAGANSMAIRKEVFENFRLGLLLGFENAKEAWFPGVDSRAKFALYAAQRGGTTDAFHAAFWIRSDEDLARARAGACLRIPVEMVREFSPEALAVMEFRQQLDIDIARKMYSRFPPLGEVVPGTPYRSYLRELESGHVQGLLTEDHKALPHYEGRMISQYDHRAKGYRSGRARAAVWEDLPFGSPDKSIQPQWYVRLEEVPAQAKLRIADYRVGFCDVASPTNERSLVAAVLPRNCVAGAKVPTVTMQSPTPHKDLLIWLAAANTFAMDFLVRMKVSLTMALTLLDSLPFPRLAAGDASGRRLIQSALKLSCTSPEMNGLWDEFARIGVVAPRLSETPPGACTEEERTRLVAAVEAEVALMFGFDRREVEHILDTFPIVRKNDEKAHGEYRTKRVILEIYDEMAEAIRTGRPYQTRLDPPAADPRVAHPARAPARAPKPMKVAVHADGAWKRPRKDHAEEVGIQLAALLKAFGGATPVDQVRLAAVLALHPQIVLASVKGNEVAEWRRLVGEEANPAQDGIAAIPQEANRAWGEAVRHLRAHQLLLEDAGAKTWAPGAGLATAFETDGWADGRARWVVELIERRGLGKILELLPQGIRGWVHGAQAA